MNEEKENSLFIWLMSFIFVLPNILLILLTYIYFTQVYIIEVWKTIFILIGLGIYCGTYQFGSVVMLVKEDFSIKLKKRKIGRKK